MKDDRGFTLIELLVVISITGIMSLGIAELFNNMNKGQSAINSSSNFESLKSSIRLTIQNSKLCNGSLQNSTGTEQVYRPTSQTFVQDLNKIKSGPSVVAQVGSSANGLTITKMTLKPFGDWPTTPYKESIYETSSVKEFDKHYTTLSLETKDNASNKIRQATFDMVVLTDQSTNAIKKCYVQANDEMKPNMVFQLGNKSDGNSTSWYCRNNIDLTNYCGDENGCRVNVKMTHKGGYYDQTLSISYVIYMEQPSLSNNTYPGVYGGTMDGANYTGTQWYSGNPADPYYNIMNPWNIFYMMTYNHSYCGAQAPLPAYHFSFLGHPAYTYSVEIQDSPHP